MQTLQTGPSTGQRGTGNGMEDLRSYAHVRWLCKYIFVVFTHRLSGKVMFSQVCVILFVGVCGVEGLPRGGCRPEAGCVCLDRDDHCRGWYSSSWNVFLLFW